MYSEDGFLVETIDGHNYGWLLSKPDKDGRYTIMSDSGDTIKWGLSVVMSWWRVAAKEPKEAAEIYKKICEIHNLGYSESLSA